MKERDFMTVGLCGRSGAGKGTVCLIFSALGIPSVDTDAVYRAMTSPADAPSPCMTALKERFGPDVESPDHSLNRAFMRRLVFGEGNEQNLADLNAISHRYILTETRRIAEEWFQKGFPIVLLDAPVLYESGFDRTCDAVVCVTAPEDVLVSRIMARDGICREDAQLRLASQIPAEELEKRTDFVIVNDGSFDDLSERVKQTADALRERLAAKQGNREADA